LHRLNQFLIFSVLIILSAVVLALFLANQLKDVIARPMRDLSNTLRQIVNDKDYSIRAVKENNDELGDLVDLFNGMLITIEDENVSLKASEERFRKLTALSPVGIFQVDPKQKLQYVNQRWRDIHGLTNELPDLQDWFEMINPKDIVMVQESWNRMVFDQESIALEIRLVRRDNAHTWIHLLASALHDRDGELLGYLGAISDISELKAAQIQMENLAFYDPLTGLANRRLFKNRLEKAVKSVLRSGKSMALMFLDMDQFKRINDTLGHDAGDEVLRQASKALSESIRRGDAAIRWGGEEFLVLLPHTDAEAAKNVVSRIMERGLAILPDGTRVTASIGLAEQHEDETHNWKDLVDIADKRLYQAKQTGRAKCIAPDGSEVLFPVQDHAEA